MLARSGLALLTALTVLLAYLKSAGSTARHCIAATVVKTKCYVNCECLGRHDNHQRSRRQQKSGRHSGCQLWYEEASTVCS